MTALHRALLCAAEAGELSFRDGWFLRDGVALPEVDAHEARELVFRGLLVKDGSQVKTTAEGRTVLAATR